MKNLYVMLGRTLVAMMFVVAMPVWGQTPQPSTAQSLFEDGVEAADAERWEKAVKLLTQSFQLQPVPKTAGWLGRALVESGDFVMGANYLQFYLHEERQASRMKDAVEEMLANITPKIATITLTMDPPEAEVFVDGNRIEEKRLAWPIHVSPGEEHSFEVRKAGFVTRTIRGKYAAGESVRLPVTLDAVIEKTDDGQKHKRSEPAAPKPSGLAPEAKVGFAVAGGLVVVAIGTGIGAAATYGPTRDAYPVGGRCFVPGCADEYDKRKGTLQGLTWTTVATSVLALGALGYGATRPQSKQSNGVGLMVTPTVGGMALSGTW